MSFHYSEQIVMAGQIKDKVRLDSLFIEQDLIDNRICLSNYGMQSNSWNSYYQYGI